MIKTTLKNVVPSLVANLKANIVPFLHSSPGIGKSATGKQLAEKFNLEFIDIRLTEMDSSDFNGLPDFVEIDGVRKASFRPFDTFPIESTPVPEGKNGWLIMLDEFNSGDVAVQAAAYKLVLDKKVGQYKLHPKVKLMAAGNLDSDNAITNNLSSALVSRMAHYEIVLNHEEWLEWAAGKVSTNITAFIGFKPRLLHNFDPRSSDPYSCPRTWEMVSNTLAYYEDSNIFIPVASLVGEGVAAEYQSFVALRDELPTVKDIIQDSKYPVPENLSIKWALIAMLAEAINKDNIEPISLFFRKFPRELQICALREIKAKDAELLNQPSAMQWRLEISKTL